MLHLLLCLLLLLLLLLLFLNVVLHYELFQIELLSLRNLLVLHVTSIFVTTAVICVVFRRRHH